MKILMISKTPLVGAPYRLADALRKIDHDVYLITLTDYPNHLKGLFPMGNQFDLTEEYIQNLEMDFDVIWIHNYLDTNTLKLLKDKFKSQMLLHVHSGIHEGPLYNLLKDPSYLSLFDQRFVVAQAWARLYQDFICIPNIVPQLQPRQTSTTDSTKTLYIPSSLGGGRFGFKDVNETNKYIDKFYNAFEARLITRNSELVRPKHPILQANLLKLRTSVHVSIDEIFTGGFHQVSLEALSTGGCVINGADIFSMITFMQAIETDEEIPFIRVFDYDQFSQELFRLNFDSDYLSEKISQSRKFASQNLTEIRLAKIIEKRVVANEG